jgi:hypothetical protein
MRSDGLTELVGDIVLDCLSGVPTIAGQPIPQVTFTIFTNTNVTSRILDAATNLSEAILMVDEPTINQSQAHNFLLCNSASGCSITGTGIVQPGALILAGPEPYSGSPGRPNVFQGSVFGNQVQFRGVPVDAPGTAGHRVFRFANIRVNASAILPAGSGTPGVVQALVSASGSASVPITSPTQVVALVQPSMVFSYRNRDNLAVSNTSTDVSFPLNTSLNRTSTTNSFILRFAEGFASSFRTVGSTNQTVPGQIYNTESGFTNAEVLGQIGRADAGTRLKAVFSNIPSGVNLYASLTNYSASGSPIWNGAILRTGEVGQVASAPASYSDFAIPPAITNPVSSGGYGPAPSPMPAAGAQLAVVNGTATAVWEVMAANPLSTDNYDFVVWWSYSAGVPPPGTVLVTPSLAPTPSGMGVSYMTAASASATLPVPRAADATPARPVFHATAGPVSITTASPLPSGLVGFPYSHILTGLGGTGNYAWTVTSGNLPAGLALSTYGVISGTPVSVALPALFRVRLTDTASTYAEMDFRLTISSGGLSITMPTQLPGGQVGMLYSLPLSATGGAGNSRWSVVMGTLPPGLTLATNGFIGGTPTVPTSSTLRLRVTDSANAYAEKDVTLSIISGGPVGISETILWYNGDLNGFAVGNQTNPGDGTIDSSVYDNFNIARPARVTSVFSNNMVHGSFAALGAKWEIRSGVSAGNGGTLVSSGITTTAFSWTPTGRVLQGGVQREYSLVVTGLNVSLSRGTYWLSVVPLGNGAGGSLISGTSGLNAIGFPKGGDNKSYTTSAFYTFQSVAGNFSCGPISGICDFSMGVATSDPVAVQTSRIGTFAGGKWRLDVTGNGSLDSTGDRDFFLGWQGATVVSGDWNGDGRTKAGVYSDGYWFLDYDGNGVWDNGVNDRLIAWGWAGAAPMVGDWNGGGKTKIGVYSNGFWFLDYDGNYLWDGGFVDKQVGWGWAGVQPIVGDWNGNGKTKIGVYSNGFWFLDYDGNYVWDGGVTDKQTGWGWSGVAPIVGDWNGDGKTKIGVYSGGYWYLDYDGNHLWQYPGNDKVWSVGWAGTTPVMGDWNGDGKTKAGAFINGYWYLDYDGNGSFEGVGTDRIFAFGSAGDTPVIGTW